VNNKQRPGAVLMTTREAAEQKMKIERLTPQEAAARNRKLEQGPKLERKQRRDFNENDVAIVVEKLKRLGKKK
jgi:hypothetical protein